MSAAARLGAVSRAYEQSAVEYQAVAVAAAEAEAAHKTARAKKILALKADDSVRMSHAEAETRAEADDEIAGLCRDRLIAGAMADSHRERLRQLREQVATGRTAVASERAADEFHAKGYGGAA